VSSTQVVGQADPGATGAGPGMVGDPRDDVAAPATERSAFAVKVGGFEGPFDLLLSLIAKHRIEVTELALHTVTDDFIAHVRAQGPAWDLDEATAFLVIAATLLDLKAARLLPDGSVEDEEDLALLEARDLLFARLLQYRAFKEVSGLLDGMLARAARQRPRDVGLEPWLAELLPEVLLGLGPTEFAAIAAEAFAPKPPEPGVSTAHVHAPAVSVREQAAILVQRLRRRGVLTFRAMAEDAPSTLVVVGRFLALLELYRDGVVAFEQATALGDLTVRWVGPQDDDEADAIAARAVTDEFAGTPDPAQGPPPGAVPHDAGPDPRQGQEEDR
jgi:segregation and condensation protein A